MVECGMSSMRTMSASGLQLLVWCGKVEPVRCGATLGKVEWAWRFHNPVLLPVDSLLPDCRCNVTGWLPVAKPPSVPR